MTILKPIIIQTSILDARQNDVHKKKNETSSRLDYRSKIAAYRPPRVSKRVVPPRHSLFMISAPSPGPRRFQSVYRRVRVSLSINL